MSNIKKTAVDASARDYWEMYFGSYGSMWVREIPRRIKAALGTNKQASNEAAIADVTVVPFGYSTAADGSLTLEGALRGSDGSSRLFKAAFDAEGTVTDLILGKQV